MDQLVISLLLWISTHSSLAVADLSPPPVVLLSPEQMTALYYRQAGVQSGAPKIDVRIQGYFDGSERATGIIYLLQPLDAPDADADSEATADPLFRERLLHELVHYAQHATGAYTRYTCPAQGEFDAYQLGGIYLRERGVADPMPGRMAWARRYSHCRAQ